MTPADEPTEFADGEQAAAPEAGRGAPAKPAAKPGPAAVTSAEDDPIELEDESAAKPSLAQRLNPIKMFRRKTPNFYLKEGRALLENNSLAQATVAFKSVLEMDSSNAPAYRGLGKVYFKKGGRTNLETSLNYYQQAIKLKPLEHELYAITAKIYEGLGKLKEATVERKKFMIMRALETEPRNPIANNNMGILFLQQGKTNQALDYFKKATDADKNFDLAYRNLSTVYFMLANKEENEEKSAELMLRATSEIEHAIAIAPTVPSLLAYAKLLIKSSQEEKALEMIEKADSTDPANKHVYQLKQNALERLGRFQEARDAFESYQAFARAEAQQSA